MIDPSLQRLNMVESQVRPSDVTDRRILRAMLEIPREKFLPASVRDTAYMDGPVPLTTDGDMRMLLPPRTFAKLIQLADIPEDGRVLDVGCASGYSTAVLAHLAHTAIGLDSNSEFAERARSLLASLGVANAEIVTGQLAHGAPDQGPYDAIVINGAVADAPRALLTQLKDGGRLVAILGGGPSAKATLWCKTGQTTDSRAAFDATAAILPGFARAREFVF